MRGEGIIGGIRRWVYYKIYRLDSDIWGSELVVFMGRVLLEYIGVYVFCV